MGSGSPGTLQGLTAEPRTRQEAPYPSLPEATATEAERTFTGTDGVLVGFRTPDYEQGISVAGYHLHFLNDEHTGGGHAFDYLLDEGVVEISTVSELRLSLPTSGPFLTADLNSKDMDAEIQQERGLKTTPPSFGGSSETNRSPHSPTVVVAMAESRVSSSRQHHASRTSGPRDRWSRARSRGIR